MRAMDPVGRGGTKGTRSLVAFEPAPSRRSQASKAGHSTHRQLCPRPTMPHRSLGPTDLLVAKRPVVGRAPDSGAAREFGLPACKPDFARVDLSSFDWIPASRRANTRRTMQDVGRR